jgi:hypothetical protein
MTLPEQSDRAVAATREFLVRLASPYGEGAIKGIRREVRAEALALLRHYPYVWSGDAIAKCDCPVQDNAAKQDILTDEEREAVAWAASCASDREHPAEATLRGLLERLSP